MDIIEKRCDFKIRTARNEEACGQVVPGNDETEFALAPNSYSADLCGEHRQMLEDALAQFIEVGRRNRAITALNSRGRMVLRGSGGRTFTSQDVRKWLREQGREVSPGGRLPNAVIQEFMSLKGRR